MKLQQLHKEAAQRLQDVRIVLRASPCYCQQGHADLCHQPPTLPHTHRLPIDRLVRRRPRRHHAAQQDPPQLRMAPRHKHCLQPTRSKPSPGCSARQTMYSSTHRRSAM
jgi:hypothetical protein